jgi:MFS family permease
LRAPGFRWLLCSTLVFAAATGMERTVTAWLALNAGGAVAVALVLAARMLPGLLFGLVAGGLADRVSRRLQLVGVGAAALPVMGALTVVALGADVSVWQLTVLSFGVGCLQVFDAPARQALATDTVADDLQLNALALCGLARHLLEAVGALAAGASISLIGVAWCYPLVAALAVLAGALAWRVHVSARRTGRVIVGGPAFGRTLERPAVQVLLASAVIAEVFGYSYLTAVPVLARDVLNGGSEGFGWLNAASGVGGMASVAVLCVLPGRVRREPLLAGMLVLYAGSVVALGRAPNLVLAATAVAVLGGCAAAFDALVQSLLQRAVPAAERGRAAGVWVLATGAGPLGNLELGGLTATIGAPLALTCNGLVMLLGALVLLRAGPSSIVRSSGGRRHGSWPACTGDRTPRGQPRKAGVLGGLPKERGRCAAGHEGTGRADA